jgi:hypothetical protein
MAHCRLGRLEGQQTRSAGDEGVAAVIEEFEHLGEDDEA